MAETGPARWHVAAFAAAAFAAGVWTTTQSGAMMAIILGVTVALIAAIWLAPWSRGVRYGLTAVVVCTLGPTADNLTGANIPSPDREPTAYADVHTPRLGYGTGQGIGEGEASPVRTSGPGRLYVAFTCRGDGEVEVRAELDLGAFVVGTCDRSHTREKRQWIELDRPQLFDLSITATENVRYSYVIQFVEAGTAPTLAGR